ncbi:FHA domain protein [Polaromonas sp. YR568]|uniref:FHA domain-containing protein n=1 Tax=Polaromonas sp. YR568 TaxID=1855301 RepID=UPI0008EB725E|nr:FHA domain-containing protein [Polaromonas sp. YR568]SFU88426.1 FHA domain protein [Polaromonas sp. YR568]
MFGRGRSSDTLLENLDASQLHASIRWTGKSWELRDHSRNGTLLNGARLSGTKGFELGVGSTIGFGPDGGSSWQVEDVSAPCNLLWPLGHDEPHITLGHSNLLPHGVAAELSIHHSEKGQWVCTTPDGSWIMEDGDEVRFAGKVWCFVLAAEVVSTMDCMAGGKPPLRAPQPALSFRVSQDEEHAWLELDDAGLHLDLGERSHHYALLILARLRLADAQRHLAPHAQGWVELERLAKMLGLDPGHLNIQIFRMRKQLALAMPHGAHVPELIERRRGSLRFGSLRFRITRGAELEADFDPLAHGQSYPEESLAA